MFVPAIPEPLAVMLVADAGNNLDVAFRIIAHRLAHECEAPPIRRPYQVRQMIRRPDEQPRLTAVGRNHKEVFRTPCPRVMLALSAIRQKHRPPTSRRTT